MNIYKLAIKDNGTNRRYQILDFVASYMGEPGLTEIGDYLGNDDLNKAIGEYVTTAVLDDENITGILAFDNGMGNFIDGVYITGTGSFEKVTATFQDRYFDMAVELCETYRLIDPYDSDVSIISVLETLHHDPMAIINGLCNEIRLLTEN